MQARTIRYVSFDQWKQIEATEVARGKRRGAPRVKFSTVPELLDATVEK